MANLPLILCSNHCSIKDLGKVKFSYEPLALYMIDFTNDYQVKLGRGHDSDVRIPDISVSRFHALIKKTETGRFILEDNNSKFGTLGEISHPVMIQPN
jgi:hypothetical protein